MTVTKLGYAKQKPISVYEDYQSAIYFSRNNTANANTKHIEQLVAGLVRILTIPMRSNTADIFTKPLPAEPHRRHTMSSLLVNIYSEDEGRQY